MATAQAGFRPTWIQVQPTPTAQPRSVERVDRAKREFWAYKLCRISTPVSHTAEWRQGGQGAGVLVSLLLATGPWAGGCEKQKSRRRRHALMEDLEGQSCLQPGALAQPW